jgi:hypothetical protein
MEVCLLGSKHEVDHGADPGVGPVPDPGRPQPVAERIRQYAGPAKVERFQFGEEDVEVPELDPAKNLVGVGVGVGQHPLTLEGSAGPGRSRLGKIL